MADIDAIDLFDARILVVDDDQDQRRALELAFTSAGYRGVEAVGSGTEALDLMFEAMRTGRPYDLVILDLILPGDTTGEEVYETLCRKMDVPIVVITGHDERDRQMRALRHEQVAEYLIKPLDPAILILRCERVLVRSVYTRQIRESRRRNERLFLNILQVMAKILEAKDPYTKYHSENVAKYSRAIAKRLGFGDDMLELVQIGGILHDFGKIGITESVLNKPGRLTASEFEAVKRHPLIATAILEPVDRLADIVVDIRHHHEWFGGGGYPDGVAGEEIPLGARILCVADSYDAMTSARSYHAPMTERQARDELLRCAGTQFDPDIVHVLLEVLDANRARREKLRDALRTRMA